MRRALLISVVVTAFLLASAGASIAIVLKTPWGRARVCAILNARVSAAIEGSLQVEGIDDISLPKVKAHGIRIVAPDGVPAIDVDRAEVELDLAALRRGHFAFRSAVIDHGTVRVTEDARGRNNMDETFRSRSPAPGSPTAESAAPVTAGAESPLDLRDLATSNMTLIIGGGTLPTLRITRIHGIMRVHELASGKVVLRFDGYSGSFNEGLPTGPLEFHDVKGHVQNESRQLLHFTGAGKSEGEPVKFELDIVTEPRLRVKIDAYFPVVSLESISTMAFAGYTMFSKSLDVTVHHGK